VIDLGGGSTELIIGTGLEPELMESISMGCVSYSLKFFPEGRLEKSCFKRAELAAANELQASVDAYRRTGWKHAVASSGTAKSLAAILRESDLCEQGISRKRSTSSAPCSSRRAKSTSSNCRDCARTRDDISGASPSCPPRSPKFGIEHLEVSDGRSAPRRPL